MKAETSVRKAPSINLNYVLIVVSAVISTWLVHEFAHCLTGELLGNDMAMTLNSGYPVTGYRRLGDRLLIDAAGPLATILQAFIFYFIIKRNANLLLYPFLAACLYMRFLAGSMNITNLNDEGRISAGFGLGTYTVPLLVILLLLYPVYRITKKYNLQPKFVAFTFILIMLFSSILILADQYLKARIL